MAREGTVGMRERERGVALVMVIMVLLVLTVLGITAVVMMTQEDQISSRQGLQKSAFYAAEAGLRAGENILQNTIYTADNLTLFISHTPSAECWGTPPSAGSDPHKPVPPPASLPAQWDLAHLGTYLTTVPGGVQEIVNQEVVQTAASGEQFGRFRAYYSLYARNNPDDTSPGTGIPSPLVNYDTKMRLVSVGFLTDANGVDSTNGSARVLAVKIIEEELNWSGHPSASFVRKEANTGATSSAFWSGVQM